MIRRTCFDKKRSTSKWGIYCEGIFRFAIGSDIPLIILGTISILGSAVGSPVQTYIYGRVFSLLAKYISGEVDTMASFLSKLRVLCCAMFAVGGGRLILTWLGIYLWLLVGENTQVRARKTLLELLLFKDIEWIGTKENLEGSLTLINRCIEEIRCGISENMGRLVQIIGSIVSLFVVAMMASWSLTLVISCAIPLLALCSLVFGKLTSKYATQENLWNAQASQVLGWCFGSGSFMRIMNGKVSDFVRFSRIVDASAVAFTKMAFAISANSAILKFLSNIVVAAGLGYGSHLVQTTSIDVGNVFTAFSACLLFGTQLSSISEILAFLNKAQASSDTIDSINIVEDESNMSSPSVDSDVGDKSLTSSKMHYKSLKMSHVSFRYRNSEICSLEDVNLELNSTQLNFIVGESGCGKSTVASLLSGLLSKTEGSLEVDDDNYDTLCQEWFTENVCFVESQTLVFERSLCDNLLLGTDLASSNDVHKLLDEACEFAELTEFVSSLPDRYDTRISSRGLSGGQIQKLGLARAWLCNKPILILDEALGFVNAKARKSLMDKIRRWREHDLTLVISHEISEIRHSDYVLILDAGRVKTSGFWSDLRTSWESSKRQTCLAPNHVCEVVNEKATYDVKIEASESADSISLDYLDNPAILQDLESRYVPSTENETVPMGIFHIVALCYRTIDCKTLLSVGLATSFLAGAAAPVLSYCFAKVLNVMVGGESQGHLSVGLWIAIIIAVAFVEFVVCLVSKMCLQYSSEKWILKLRKTCLSKINDQDMSYFLSRNSALLNTLLMNDTRDLRNLVSEFLSGLLLVISLTSLGISWAIAIGWKLALVGMSFVPLVLLVTIVYGLLLQHYETRYKDHVASAEKFSQEAVAAIRTVRSFGLSQQLLNEYDSKMGFLYKAGMKRAAAAGFGLALSELCSSVATATILYYGMYLIAHQEYSESQMLSVLTLLTFTVASASLLMKQLPEVARGQRAGTLISQILSLSDSSLECEGSSVKAIWSPTKPVVAFKNVHFSYPDSSTSSYRKVLRDLTFDIYPGETVALVGECGSGKSTISSLLLRLYQQDRGSIQYCGQDIASYDPEWYRSVVSVVPQVPVFLESSIIDNLLYGLSGSARVAGESFVDTCLKAVNAFDFVYALPNNVSTILGPETNLSLGQLQRLAVARVLVRRPKVIVFDEPTSNLDSVNTSTMIDMIFTQLRSHDTSIIPIVISHDPAVMLQASRVMMLHHGSVCEDGSFHQLVNKGQIFSQFIH